MIEKIKSKIFTSGWRIVNTKISWNSKDRGTCSVIFTSLRTRGRSRVPYSWKYYFFNYFLGTNCVVWNYFLNQSNLVTKWILLNSCITFIEKHIRPNGYIHWYSVNLFTKSLLRNYVRTLLPFVTKVSMS